MATVIRPEHSMRMEKAATSPSAVGTRRVGSLGGGTRREGTPPMVRMKWVACAVRTQGKGKAREKAKAPAIPAWTKACPRQGWIHSLGILSPPWLPVGSGRFLQATRKTEPGPT